MRELERRSAANRNGGRYERSFSCAVRDISELRSLLSSQRRAGSSIGLVPTMGALHEGHLSLLRRARAECDVVVLTIFVNPLQFTRGEDLDSYPRQEERDLELATMQNVDIVFAPPPAEIYSTDFRTSVHVDNLSEKLCGDPAQRGPEHFHGVTTVVAKLFNIVGPDTAYFGHKDAQQVRVIRQMVRDLNFPIEIVICPTVREPDGLAMSSRNACLSASERQDASALYRALRTARRAIECGVGEPEVALHSAVAAGRAALAAPAIDIEYFEIVSADDLRPPRELAGELLITVAARIGKTRLIDNLAVDLNTNSELQEAGTMSGSISQPEAKVHA